MSTHNTAPVERTRALLDHLESIQHRIDRSAGALRAARDLSCLDGSLPRRPEFAFLRQEDFSYLCDLIIDQLDLASQELTTIYEETHQ